MPTAYGYARASTGRQSLTFDVQKNAVEQHYRSALEPKGFAWGGMFEDKAVSGNTPFTEREQGLKLWVITQPGDAIVWMKMDRASRSTADGARLLEMLKAKNVSVHSLDLGLDMTTPTGQFMANLLISLGQLERSWISSRTKDAFAARKARGLPATNAAPAGYKRQGPKKSSELVPDPVERALLDEVWREFLGGKSMEKISNELYWKGVRRKKGSQYRSDFFIYAMVARALGYPILFTYAEYKVVTMSHRDTMYGKGRKVILKKVEMAQSGNWPSS